MFASQLLQILQTIPAIINPGNCAFDAAMLEAIMKKNQNGALCDVNNHNDTAAWLASDINDKDGYFNTPELECTMVVEDVAPSTVSSIKTKLLERDRDLYTDKNSSEIDVIDENEFRKIELLKKDTDLYTDKSVMESELPELMVCYKNNTFHVVKDICIDEGLPSKDKILIECENGKGLHTILHSNGNKNGGMTVEEIELLSPDGSKSSSDDDYHEVDSYECGTEGKVAMELLVLDASKSSDSDLDDDIGNNSRSLVLVEAGEANCNEKDKIADDGSSEKSVTNCMPSSLVFVKQNSLKSLLKAPACGGNEVAQQSAQVPCSRPLCDNPAAVSAPELSNRSNLVNNLSYNSKVESATITFDFNSSKSEAIRRDEGPDVVHHEQPFKINSEPRHENGFSGSLEATTNEAQHGQGESSFSMAGSVPGLINYSGSIPNSGSVSLRSDSSATSTRSFAFPVLQAEWNSSPVRMAKADRRHYRRHKCWRHCLLCCRF
ncbi:Protein BREAKING OF ASYMMETRY IN THE STOMATAL LINEAGE like [Actinidia chinensis var. chinensis]|uniref:Protein BREAKING OF ASYMMETRY IN THE STOMATAL LINEAGE like n=1 Tax=Actinidia chinensis var. chinensis TaxID=1590841 RepID=A0A2R6PAZ4_ACTCC|nr:Protein BREAKING OF ASYMMETRY IN THE STOMATAL LINEAGE like [Actinidia chinensis var. chinensis]